MRRGVSSNLKVIIRAWCKLNCLFKFKIIVFNALHTRIKVSYTCHNKSSGRCYRNMFSFFSQRISFFIFSFLPQLCTHLWTLKLLHQGLVFLRCCKCFSLMVAWIRNPWLFYLVLDLNWIKKLSERVCFWWQDSHTIRFSNDQ